MAEEFLRGFNLAASISSLSATETKKLAELIASDGYEPADIAMKMELREPLRFHTDNMLGDDALYSDVKECIRFFVEIRKGVNPMEIEGFMSFLEGRPKTDIAKVISHGTSIQLKLLPSAPAQIEMKLKF
jgi:hypothetical protein